MDDFTTLTIDDGVALVTMDDGKANAWARNDRSPPRTPRRGGECRCRRPGGGWSPGAVLGRLRPLGMKAGGDGPREMLSSGVDLFLGSTSFPGRWSPPARASHRGGRHHSDVSDLRVGTGVNSRSGCQNSPSECPSPSSPPTMRDRLSKRHWPGPRSARCTTLKLLSTWVFPDETLDGEKVLDVAVAQARVAGGVGRGAWGARGSPPVGL
ncbi:MAG: hypothetical protein CM1200mP26_21210 [Acidimicrobiales bacterium]|nr:MAG: hypothetical protein CM1200mP26_21210 [Acidimicrobiales bacterium]